MTKTQTNDFAARLKLARIARYPKIGDALAVLKEYAGVKEPTYYSYENGRRTPRAKNIGVFAHIFGVEPEWLLYGKPKKGSKFNQLTGDFTETPSQPVDVRCIPILSASQTIIFIAEGNLMSTDWLPIPNRIGAGKRAFAWEIPPGDQSMNGGDNVCTPGTYLIVDPDQDVLPEQWLLVSLKGHERLFFRIYQAALPLSALPLSETFTLFAANPFYEPIKIRSRKSYLYAGRVLSTMHIR
jgi:transcriptional regulator with XRE-family HTH domain